MQVDEGEFLYLWHFPAVQWEHSSCGTQFGYLSQNTGEMVVHTYKHFLQNAYPLHRLFS